MKKQCKKCGRTLIVPSWTTCNDCDDVLSRTPRPTPQPKPLKESDEPVTDYARRRMDGVSRYMDDRTTIAELQKSNPAQPRKRK